MSQTILITGCSSGLGRSAAILFANRGWDVIATMRMPEATNDFEPLPNVLVTKLDVQEESSIASSIEEGIRRFGGIDALVNNAGYGHLGVFETILPEKVREQFDVNVFGMMATTRAILPHFRSRQTGIIANVSSGAGIYGLPALSLYCASKFALEGFSEAISYELASQGIRVKIIEPGGVTSTGFGRRGGKERASNQNIADYDAFGAKTMALFAKMGTERKGTEDQVAECIFTALTDGTDQLRYIATDDIKPLIHARRETSEEDYMAFMRSYFNR